MPEMKYEVAEDLETAWLNFELDLPLEPSPSGQAHPFYVDRPDNPTAALEEALLLPFNAPPKIFFSGHRGCGKSTELYRVAVNPAITAKYWPVHFSIEKGPGVDNVDYRDVLLEIGGQLYSQYQANKRRRGHLNPQLLKELSDFRGAVEKEIIKTPGRVTEAEVGAGLSTFFAEASAKIKIEPHSRTIIRQVIDQNIRTLVELINNLALNIRNLEQRWPLILIDDLDKPSYAHSREIFVAHRETMLQPNLPIVYTVSSPLFYQPEIRDLLGIPIFLPNIKVHDRGQPDNPAAEGYRTLRMFVRKRMVGRLITDEALDEAIRVSGGVFRELCRVLRSAISYARRARREQLELEDIGKAEAEIRAFYWRFLTPEQRELLRKICQHNQYKEAPEKMAPLLQSLAVLEYANGEPWCDVHPALLPLLAAAKD